MTGAEPAFAYRSRKGAAEPLRHVTRVLFYRVNNAGKGGKKPCKVLLRSVGPWKGVARTLNNRLARLLCASWPQPHFLPARCSGQGVSLPQRCPVDFLSSVALSALDAELQGQFSNCRVVVEWAHQLLGPVTSIKLSVLPAPRPAHGVALI